MLRYYFSLAARGLRHNAALTLLTIGVIGVGIACLMTVLTVVRTMSADPISGKSSRLFAVEIDNWGPDNPGDPVLHDQLTYADALALMRARRGRMQTATYAVTFAVTPSASSVKPFLANGRAADSDFFEMFDAPFRSGAPWSRLDDEGGGTVVVLGADIASRLFPGEDAVGRTVELDGQIYRVVGVLRRWRLQPRFYDLTPRLFQQTEDVFLPFSTAIDHQMQSFGTIDCDHPPASGWTGMLTSECRWLQFWVELDSREAVGAYRNFLHGYGAQQERLGRFHWPPAVGLYDVKQWLAMENMVPDGLRLSALVAFGFLLVCLVNVVSLMLAKFRSRASELLVRRALGASKLHIALQCLAEALAVGSAGAVLGLSLTSLGLAFERGVLRDDYVQFAHLNGGIAVMTVALAVLSVGCSSLYPAWRASQPEPDWRIQSP